MECDQYISSHVGAVDWYGIADDLQVLQSNVSTLTSDAATSVDEQKCNAPDDQQYVAESANGLQTDLASAAQVIQAGYAAEKQFIAEVHSNRIADFMLKNSNATVQLSTALQLANENWTTAKQQANQMISGGEGIDIDNIDTQCNISIIGDVLREITIHLILDQRASGPCKAPSPTPPRGCPAPVFAWLQACRVSPAPPYPVPGEGRPRTLLGHPSSLSSEALTVDLVGPWPDVEAWAKKTGLEMRSTIPQQIRTRFHSRSEADEVSNGFSGTKHPFVVLSRRGLAFSGVIA